MTYVNNRSYWYDAYIWLIRQPMYFTTCLVNRISVGSIQNPSCLAKFVGTSNNNPFATVLCLHTFYSVRKHCCHKCSFFNFPCKYNISVVYNQVLHRELYILQFLFFHSITCITILPSETFPEFLNHQHEQSSSIIDFSGKTYTIVMWSISKMINGPSITFSTEK